MLTNGICNHCGKKIRFGISLCNECNNIKRNSLAMVSQNKKKLKKLLSQRSITPEWFNKFIIYTNNIVKYGRILMEYKEMDTIRSFDNLKKIGFVIIFVIVMLIV